MHIYLHTYSQLSIETNSSYIHQNVPHLSNLLFISTEWPALQIRETAHSTDN